jgi:hypothetical protein
VERGTAPLTGRGDSHLSGARKSRVVDAEPSEGYTETWLKLEDASKEIEEFIVRELLVRHSKWIEAE